MEGNSVSRRSIIKRNRVGTKISVKTVETYKSRMMDKLGLQTRTALVRFALELGMLQKTETSEAP